MILKRIDRRGGSIRGSGECLRSRRLAVQAQLPPRRCGAGVPRRRRCRHARPPSHRRRSDRSPPPCPARSRRRGGRIRRSRTRVSDGQDRQPHLSQQFVVLARRGHDAAEEILAPRRCAGHACSRTRSRRRASRQPCTIRTPDRRAPRCRRRCRGCGSDDARCGARRSRAACPAGRRPPAGRTPHAAPGADRRACPLPSRSRSRPAHAVDVDEMRRPRQPECHDRHQALPAGQHPAVVRTRPPPASRPPHRPFSARDSERRRAS